MRRTYLGLIAGLLFALQSCSTGMTGADARAESPESQSATVAPATAVSPATGNMSLWNVAYKSAITKAQPMAGIVFWDENAYLETTKDCISLEYIILGYDEIVSAEGAYNWSKLEKRLDDIASRNHQAIVKFIDVAYEFVDNKYDYPTRMPRYLYQNETKYGEILATHKIAGITYKYWFTNWENPKVQAFLLEFMGKFAERYDANGAMANKIAFLEAGFGSWSEYNLSLGFPDGEPFVLDKGKNFPGDAYQIKFLNHMDSSFANLKWLVSVDISAQKEYGPFNTYAGQKETISYGLFDDSFMILEHDEVNAKDWADLTNLNGAERFRSVPFGGEFSYGSYTPDRITPTDYPDIYYVLQSGGIYDRTFPEMAKRYHISYMIGSGILEGSKDLGLTNIAEADIRQASLDTGYRFKLTSVQSSTNRAEIVLMNIGAAPIYYDTYVYVDGIRCPQNLKYLYGSDTLTVSVDAPITASSRIEIRSDRMLPSQKIEFEADTPGESYTQGLIFSLNSDRQGYTVSKGSAGNLTSIRIPATYEGLPVTAIECMGFMNCEIESLTIPPLVKTIGGYAFMGCAKLRELVLYDGLESIGANAFSGCSSLTVLNLPSTLTSLGNSAFYECSSLTELTLPGSLGSIGFFGFARCKGLTKIVMENGVAIIGERAFDTCVSLAEVFLPQTITAIGESAFINCAGLKTVRIEATTVPALRGNHVFKYTSNGSLVSTVSILVPASAVEAYKNAPNWTAYAGNISGFAANE
jgi:BspA type Leucine rich repeat region (6 copies)